MKDILITGGAGFIGSNLALKLLDKGFRITILDNLHPQIHGQNPTKDSPLYQSVKDQVSFIQASITDRPSLEYAIKGQDCIVHLAAETGTGQSMYEIERYNQVNIGGTALLLDILANKPHEVKKVVIASSRAIYGEGRYWDDQLGFVYPNHRSAADMEAGDFEVKYPGASALKLKATDENSLIHPSSVYGITKQVQEQLVMTVCPAIGIAPVAFRYQNVYGPGQSLSNPYTGILSIFSTCILQNKPINIFEDGKESRDFVFIEDVVDATILGIENEAANGVVFNVGTGVATSVIQVVESLMENYGIKVPFNISGNYRLGDIRHNFADISKINSLLGFSPRVGFNEGIRLFTDWVKRQNQLPSDQYEASLEEMKSKGLLK
ncbi:MAG: NAD-dependent epimerase/dehydratase family protein [Weeksellaceae bacterium]|nr:NAD-dependent epimerase/dehydratase family protein [Weeksellaceae bacterium]